MRISPRRAARIATGLTKSGSRDAYVTAARRKLAKAIAPAPPPKPRPVKQPTVSSSDEGAKPAGPRCRACRSSDVRKQRVHNTSLDRSMPVIRCRACGHVAIPANVRDYSEISEASGFELKPRVGTPERPGREFAMASMAVKLMERSDLDVLVYGAGRSYDNHHIQALPRVRSVTIGDVMNFRDDAEVLDITQPAERTFDLIIACEVIEHFLNPRPEFARLFGYLRSDGLLVCSTNIFDGKALDRHAYIFRPGHVSYYTPKSLRAIAKKNGYRLDFRVPKIATGFAGPRKRYVLLTKSTEIMDRAADYFGQRMYAPAERVDAQGEPLPLRRSGDGDSTGNSRPATTPTSPT